jgi:hypothetical protein
VSALREGATIGEFVMLGGNIKIHFAGCEQVDFALVAHEAGVQYFLWTVFPFIAGHFIADYYPIMLKSLFPPHVLEKIGKHTIMDSGIFTLMFGSHAGQRDKPFLERYMDALITFVKANNLKSTVVEIDCQKILGVKESWEFRQKLRDQLPNRQINVFHIDDGQKGLDRIIEFATYIAISCLDVRDHNRKNYRDNIYRLASYIKNKKPEIDIHLLGCTQKTILNDCRFCTSADSTSWQGVNRFGHIMNYATKYISEAAYREAVPKLMNVFYYCHIEPTELRLTYYGNYYLAAFLYKRMYEQCAGGQD